jgi:hypothetical protein
MSGIRGIAFRKQELEDDRDFSIQTIGISSWISAFTGR